MTNEANAKLATLMLPWLRGGQIVVSDGTAESASAPAEFAVDGATIIATAVFDERTANFHWQHRELRANDGTLVDALAADFGEKMLGAIWTLEVPLEVRDD
jgi:hypothetical protein